MTLRNTTLLLLLMIFSCFANAKHKERKKKGDAAMPKAVFVQLPVYQNRMTALKNNHETKTLAKLTRDRDSFISKITMDFNENFHYCPVYYFMDTNFYRISSGDFENVFLDKELNHIEPSVKPGEDFLIVTFGLPIPGPGDIDPKNVAPTTYNVVRTTQKLVVMNNKMELVKRPELNDHNYIYRKSLLKPAEDYTYESPDFDIYYKPYAKDLEIKLKTSYGKKR